MTTSGPMVTPVSLRWVIPATVLGAVLVLALLWDVQHDRLASHLASPSTESVDAAAVQDPMQFWLERTEPVVAAMREAFNDVSDAVLSSDFAGAGVACRDGLVSTTALQAELPSPDGRLDQLLRQALGEYDEALRLCISGTEHGDDSAYGRSSDLVAAGNRHWRMAVGTLDRSWALEPPGDSRRHLFKT